jgi:hypothetical protein
LFWDKENGVVPEFPTAKLKYLAEAGFRLENASNKSQSSDRISVEEDNFSLTNLAVYYMLVKVVNESNKEYCLEQYQRFKKYEIIIFCTLSGHFSMKSRSGNGSSLPYLRQGLL